MTVPSTVSILDGDTFVVSDGRGDIDASPTETVGLFHRDTRYLSRWLVTVDGLRLNALSTDDLHYFSAQFFLVPGTGTIYVDAKISVVRRRVVGEGFHEEIEILNHANEPFDLTVRIAAGADFADLFEVKDALAKKGQLYRRVEDGRLVLGYRRERFVRETWIEHAPEGAVDEDGITFRVHLEPHGEWRARFDVIAAVEGRTARREEVKYRSVDVDPRPAGQSLAAWRQRAPELVTSRSRTWGSWAFPDVGASPTRSGAGASTSSSPRRATRDACTEPRRGQKRPRTSTRACSASCTSIAPRRGLSSSSVT